MGKGKNRGSQFEREISKYLTKWISGNINPLMLWRQESSGALSTIYSDNNHLTGDIKSIHTDSKFLTDVFSIELKTGYISTSFFQHFNNYTFGIEEFWKQASNDAEKANKHAMLIYRKKHRKPIVGIDEKINKILKKKLYSLNNIMICWGNESSLKSCILYDMNLFFNKIKPEDIRKLKICL